MVEREGWEVIGEFQDEAFSAFHGNRGPGLAAAKQRAIDSAPCVLVAQDADRFARGAGDAPGAADHLGEMFFVMRRHGVEISDGAQPPARSDPGRPRGRAGERRDGA